MAYATLDTLLALQPQEVLLQLADDGNVGSFFIRKRPTAAYKNVEAAINEAQSIIDSYIAGRYRLPLNEPYPPLIIQMASHLALCSLYDRRRELDMPKGIKDRRDRYMALLKDIQADKASIPELRTTTSAGVLVSTPCKEFSNSLLARM
jgi:phage gp36-like protein